MSDQQETIIEDKTENETEFVDIRKVMEDAKNPEPEDTIEPKESAEVTTTPEKILIEDSTPEQAQRFKEVEAKNKLYWGMIQEQQARLDKLEGRISEEDKQAAEKAIFAKIKDATDEGDTDLLTKSIDELIKFRTTSDKKVEKTSQKVNEIPEDQSQDLQYIADLASETDENGNLLRPWLAEGSENADEIAGRAEQIASHLFQKNPNDPYILAKVFRVLDKELSVKPSTQKPLMRVPEPMSGSHLTRQVQKSKIKISAEELDICRKLNCDPDEYLANKPVARAR